MSVTMGAPVQLGPRTWRLSWGSDLASPTYYVWRDGRLVCETSETSMAFTVAAGESLVVEVLDDAGAEPESHWPARARLEWQGGAAIECYRIDEYYGGDWIERARVVDRGEGRFHWDSRVLEDVTSHQFRVVAIGTNGNAGAARSFVILMVRMPDPPDVGYAYSGSTRRVTISAA